MQALANAGFRVIAPDMRGYAGSEAPPKVSDYRMSELVADVLDLLDAFGAREAAVVSAPRTRPRQNSKVNFA